ncbi:MAG TPA: amidohydrolase family protein, partial [Gemmatimonadales bacterium]|nr:amidohydrolase family protein [Gemmatimonadales bacterium]
GLWMAVLAGVDVLQHPETVGGARLPAELVDTLQARGTICALMPAVVTGAEWARFQRHLELGGRMWPAEKPPAMMEAEADSLRRSGIDPRTRPRSASVTRFQNQRLNAESLIRDGCLVAVASDEVVALPGAKSRRAFGEQFLDGVEGLVELGMTPGDALVSATRNAAAAAGQLNEIGTIAPGKRADLVILEADPLADIGNIRRVATVIHGGRVFAGGRRTGKP